MASLKDIRKRIDSVKRTQKTTSAMKMVSAAKLRRSENAIREATPYANKLKSVVSSLSTRFDGKDQDTGFGLLFQNSGGKRTGVILITSDRGLCGGFNSNLSKALARQLADEEVECAEFVILGRKGNEFFKRSAHNILANHTGTSPGEQLVLVRDIVSEFTSRFEAGDLDQVILAYNHYVSVIAQVPVIEQLLPITQPETEIADERDIIFEPSPQDILETLLKKYVQNQVYVSWLDTIAGEHAARMISMDAATKNAGEMIEKLQLHYNRSRQAAITRELIEIISGAESL
ncbi:MAG TPA: ATP synthase F1 subunit gamma [Deltaproteobacteria bacterium]|jgi:F-type H+-transporting ATPase subunit gamma|uniref:ATP synthase gamma chain n=2 Tax=SAR324 cluster bacterium TaxID=2024889 RepID=A0A432GHJ5_9DELT|nr:ATP synthase F1 subunit gamma [SAR324 cluster bacterium]HBD28471.1 ATP synthase F1 subunit gamma [Deltaproteobacteria bacterium]MCH2282041.1 ATP synthase F1 subunit gamma [SAR324 cluster bacterium]RTZ79919.1 MAG: ATP synthase F1 subunit gamma [SAR324 cluster bacterium]RTZ83244.1 MAG: ATP synthase F1 subunit gamma [SAR324 cluster bacterium]